MAIVDENDRVKAGAREWWGREGRGRRSWAERVRGDEALGEQEGVGEVERVRLRERETLAVADWNELGLTDFAVAELARRKAGMVTESRGVDRALVRDAPTPNSRWSLFSSYQR